MPVLMIIVGLAILAISLFTKNIYYLNSAYALGTFLFFFLPASTIGLVHRKFDPIRRASLYQRMLVTSIPGIVAAILFFTPLWKIALSAMGLLGALYFTFDFFKQRKTYHKIRTKLEKIVSKEEIFNDIISTKCSRSMIERAAKEHSPELWRKVKRKIRKKGYRWWHFFPTGKRSLTAEIFSKK
ncbi:MAG: hypothetical protein ACPGTS_00600 [Minisyncoccia bacterium]